MISRYDVYKDSGVEWIGAIPDHWEVRKLKNLAKICNGKDYQNISMEKGGYPVYGTGGEFARCEKFLYNKPSVLLGRKGTIDNPLIVTEPFWTSDTMYYTEINEDVIPKFFFYLVKQINFDRYRYGSAVPSMTKSVYDEMYFPYCQLPEQTQIVSYLDEKTALIDKLISVKQRKIELLKEKRTALINQAVTKGLNPNVKMKDSGVEWIGEIPEHWECSRVKQEFEFHNNKRIPLSAEERSSRQGEYRYYGASGVIDFVDEYLFDGEYLLIGEDGANILNRSTPLVFSVSGQFWVNNHAHILKNRMGSIKFFEFQMEINDYSTIASGSAQPKLTKDALAEVRLFVPPEEEQAQIVSYLDEKTKEIDDLLNFEQKKIDLLKEYRQSLISEVLTGKIKVTTD